MWILALIACTRSAPVETDETGAVPVETADTHGHAHQAVVVQVLLDGEPVADTLVRQPGTAGQWRTGEDGTVEVELDRGLPGGEVWVVGSHPEARIWGAEVDAHDEGPVVVELTRYDTSDNEDYAFQDPGEPTRRDSTGQCLHCHVTIGEDWYASPHRASATNPAVQDLYAGTAAALADADSCASAGGRWWTGRAPGGGEAERCHLGEGVLPSLNDCGTDAPCEDDVAETGACADCHAPGIDGALGGRDLLEATGHAYDYGVHCDVCHKVDEVVLEAEAGVAGRLRITRPSEAASSPALGSHAPLQFGPYDDVPHIRMGSVQRDHFLEATICAGCHEQHQPVLVPDATIDSTRWPDGRLPVHTTYSEWEDGPMSPDAPCQSCHMPPDPAVGNASDLYNEFDITPGMAAGWERPPGAVRRHAWYGPRQRESRMLELAAALWVEEEVADGALTTTVRVKNVGPGHAIPTGEPLRSLILLVEASCDGEALEPTGGSAVPDFGGWLDRKEAGEDWSRWAGAEAGQRIRVVRRTGAWHDYTGHGPFGDGTFDAEQKGMPVEEVAGSATIVAVDGETVTLDRALPDGDVAYRVDGTGLPADGDAATARAGAPGFGFARVMVGADGARMVPHFLAVDVASDNRLLPQQDFTTTHTFEATCDDPDVRVVLLHRAFPLELAAERAWTLTESVMAEGSR